MNTNATTKTAVALYYDGNDAPHLTAKGHGELAERIIAVAAENGVPLQEDEALCAMLAELDLGDSIPHELYVAVAEVLAFAYFVTGRIPEGQVMPGQPKSGAGMDNGEAVREVSGPVLKAGRE